MYFYKYFYELTFFLLLQIFYELTLKLTSIIMFVIGVIMVMKRCWFFFVKRSVCNIVLIEPFWCWQIMKSLIHYLRNTPNLSHQSMKNINNLYYDDNDIEYFQTVNIVSKTPIICMIECCSNILICQTLGLHTYLIS